MKQLMNKAKEMLKEGYWVSQPANIHYQNVN